MHNSATIPTERSNEISGKEARIPVNLGRRNQEKGPCFCSLEYRAFYVLTSHLHPNKHHISVIKTYF